MNHQTTPSPITSGEALKIARDALWDARATLIKSGARLAAIAACSDALAITEATITPSGELPPLHDFRADEVFAGLLDEVLGATKEKISAAPMTRAMRRVNAYLQMLMEEYARAALAQRASAPAVATGGAVGAWKVGSLLSVNTYDYPGMGSLFAQVWQGDDLIARVYGDTADEVRSRADRITAPTAEEATGGVQGCIKCPRDPAIVCHYCGWDRLPENGAHSAPVALLAPAKQAAAVPACDCETCSPNTSWLSARFIVCAICGNKRCPHATDHRNTCTNSNEAGQPGSSYENVGRAAATTDGEGE